jgi:hypothetical protein
MFGFVGNSATAPEAGDRILETSELPVMREQLARTSQLTRSLHWLALIGLAGSFLVA